MNFEMEGMDISEMKTYNLTDEKKVPVIENWLGQKCL